MVQYCTSVPEEPANSVASMFFWFMLGFVSMGMISAYYYITFIASPEKHIEKKDEKKGAKKSGKKPVHEKEEKYTGWFWGG